MTKRATYKIPDTDFRMPMPGDMPADMPAIMREFRRPLELSGDGSPIDDQGLALFEAVVEYFGVDEHGPEAGWRLASHLLSLLLPGSHHDPRGPGGRTARDADELARLGKLWVDLKREANSGAYEINQSSVYKTNETTIRASSRLFRTVSPGKSSLNLLAKAEIEFQRQEFNRNSLKLLQRISMDHLKKIHFTESTKTSS